MVAADPPLLPLFAQMAEAHQQSHALGILIDDAAHFGQRDLLERYLLRRGALEAFGWRVAQVFTKDWRHDPGLVLRQIDEAMAGIDSNVSCDAISGEV